MLVLAKDSTEFALNIDTANEGAKISQELFGVFYEDINSSGDGGMATELVKIIPLKTIRTLIHRITQP